MEALHTTYLLTGSNLADRLDQLSVAKAIIVQQIGEVTAGSAIYETAAWGIEDQPPFLNQVLEVKTALQPLPLLQAVQEIEPSLGRTARSKWGPRVIDIDILFYDGLIIETPELTVPHPFLHQRRFTLQPLAEIAQGLVHPVFQITIRELLARCDDPLKVERLAAAYEV